MNTEKLKAELKIRRFDGVRSYWDSFEVPIKKGMTLLEALYYIKENIDSSLSFRSSCRMGICGSCAVRVNGKAVLACETQMLKLVESNKPNKSIRVEPLNNFNVIRDLIVEFDDFFKKHEKVKPYLIRKRKSKEIRQTPQELRRYYLYTLCIKCGACISACPVAKNCLGPAPVVSAYRFNMDSRDEGKDERLKILSEEIWHCHFVTECSNACPKELEPAEVIQKLRLEVLKYCLQMR